MRSPSGAAALHAVLRYIWEVCDVGMDEFRESVLAAVGEDEEVKDAMTTTAEKLRDEGRVEGRLEGERAVLLRLLAKRFGDLPDAVLARVDAATVDQLELWAERVLVAHSLAEVLGDA